MSGAQNGPPRGSKTPGPLRATMPISSVTKEGSALRRSASPTLSCRTGSADNVLGRRRACVTPSAKVLDDCPPAAPIRRTASLDMIYLKGLFPREGVFWHRDRGTQTETSASLDCLHTLNSSETMEDRLARLTIRQRLNRTPVEANVSSQTGYASPSSSCRSPCSSGGNQPKSSRSSEEGLNLEIESYIARSESDLQCDRLKQPTPEGRKAPIADLLREPPYLKPFPVTTSTGSAEDSQGSSPEQDRMATGSSPRINKFSARAPPDGCEKVLSKSVPILRPIPREIVSSHPHSMFTLKPSSHSAFESLQQQQKEAEEKEKGRRDRGGNSSSPSPIVPDRKMD